MPIRARAKRNIVADFKIFHLLESFQLSVSKDWEFGIRLRDILSCFCQLDTEKRKAVTACTHKWTRKSEQLKNAPLFNTFSAGCHPLQHCLTSDPVEEMT